MMDLTEGNQGTPKINATDREENNSFKSVSTTTGLSSFISGVPGLPSTNFGKDIWKIES